MIREKSCGAVIYRTEEDRKVYLIEWMRGGHVSLCKGHMEKGETEHQTATREIREETGIDVSYREGFRETIEYPPYPGCVKEVVFFAARALTADTVPQESEVSRIGWLTLDEALSALTYESDREVLRRADAFLSRQSHP